MTRIEASALHDTLIAECFNCHKCGDWNDLIIYDLTEYVEAERQFIAICHACDEKES